MSYDPAGKTTAMMNSQEKKDFRRMLQLYDDKKSTKAMEIVDTLLESYPNHVECISFKAMVLNQMKNHTEALEWINKALNKDFKSFACWHVFGIIKKSTKDYEGATKAYL